MYLGLVGCQGTVLAQLPQKLALAAAEAVGLTARADEDAEDLSLYWQGRRDEGSQAAACQSLRKREIEPVDLRLVDEVAADTARQAVLVDGNAGMLGHRKLLRQWSAGQAHCNDREGAPGRVVEADTTEIQRQLFLQCTHHDLEDAGKILPLADRARD